MRILISAGGREALHVAGIVGAYKETYPEAQIDFFVGDEPAPLLENNPDFNIVASPDEHEYDLKLPYEGMPTFDWSPPKYCPTDEELGTAPASVFVVYGIDKDVVSQIEDLYAVIQIGEGPTSATLRPRVSDREAAAIIYKTEVVIAAEGFWSFVAAILNKPLIVLCDGEITSYIGENAIVMTKSAANSVIVHTAWKIHAISHGR